MHRPRCWALDKPPRQPPPPPIQPASLPDAAPRHRSSGRGRRKGNSGDRQRRPAAITESQHRAKRQQRPRSPPRRQSGEVQRWLAIAARKSCAVSRAGQSRCAITSIQVAGGARSPRCAGRSRAWTRLACGAEARGRLQASGSPELPSPGQDVHNLSADVTEAFSGSALAIERH